MRSHYGGITLLSLPEKVSGRVQLLVNPQIQEGQCSLHPGRQTLAQLYTLTASCMVVCPANLLHHCILWEQAADSSMLQAIQAFYSRSQSLVCIACSESGSFPFVVGLNKGFMDRVSKHSQVVKVKVSGSCSFRILSLLYADDMLLLALPSSDLQLAQVGVPPSNGGIQVSWDLGKNRNGQEIKDLKFHKFSIYHSVCFTDVAEWVQRDKIANTSKCLGFPVTQNQVSSPSRDIL